MAHKSSGTRGRLTLGIDNEDVGVFLIATGQRKRRQFVTMSQYDLSGLAGNQQLGLTELRLLLTYASRIDYDNCVYARVGDVCQQLHISRTAYHRAARTLSDLGLIVRGTAVGALWLVMLNPAVACRGSLSAERRLLGVYNAYRTGIDTPSEP